MITKKEKELIEARTHEKGMAMTPVEELALLGFYDCDRKTEIEQCVKTDSYTGCTPCDNGHRATSVLQKDWKQKEEYEFDSNDEYYRQLDVVLRRNNDRQKYFA